MPRVHVPGRGPAPRSDPYPYVSTYLAGQAIQRSTINSWDSEWPRLGTKRYRLRLMRGLYFLHIACTSITSGLC